MLSFYTIVTIIAIVLLIIALTIIGLAMRKNTLKDEYPDYQYLCPDSWTLQADQKTCMPNSNMNNPEINPVNPRTPLLNAPNTGTIVHSGVNISSNRIASINISSDNWPSMCEKTNWAKKNKILWDGIANNNTCV